MKKILTIAVLVGMTAGAILLSAFTTPKQDAKTECSQIQMNDDWMLYREGVAYCDGDTDQCVGQGNIYVNSNTYQARIRVYYQSNYYYYDLTDYTKKEGYNMRFWDSERSTYYYVYINIRY